MPLTVTNCYLCGFVIYFVIWSMNRNKQTKAGRSGSSVSITEYFSSHTDLSASWRSSIRGITLLSHEGLSIRRVVCNTH